MVRFFIDRPIFAWVIAIAVSLLGLLAGETITLLAVNAFEEYPIHVVGPPLNCRRTVA